MIIVLYSVILLSILSIGYKKLPVYIYAIRYVCVDSGRIEKAPTRATTSERFLSEFHWYSLDPGSCSDYSNPDQPGLSSVI